MGVGKKDGQLECQAGLLENHNKGLEKAEMVAANDAVKATHEKAN
jgi:hypothetical protein